MLEKEQPQENVARLRFGAGVNSRASADEIDAQECAEGENFVLDIENSQFRPRPGFDLVAQLPNGEGPHGYAQLHKTDGTISTLIQGGDKVYEWDGTKDGLTEVATVSASARLRGPLSANWELDDKVIITDLSKAETVKEWDGSTFQDLPHNLTDDFYAKYAFVESERAWYGNVTAGTATPHMLVGSAVEDHTELSVSDKPSSALGFDDPFYLLTPDLRAINGAVNAFKNIILSSRHGRLFRITGSSAKDFDMNTFYGGSASSGDEGLTLIGNDVFIGDQGIIDTLSGVEQFGDVETDDATRKIADQIKTVDAWTVVYDRRQQRVYCFPESRSECWVFFKSIYDDITGRVRRLEQAKPKSPWVKWTTMHSAGFNPVVAMAMRNPGTKRIETYFGDNSGNLYQMEGNGDGDDGTPIRAKRTSPVIRAPSNSIWDVNGWVLYRKRIDPYNVTLRVKFSGDKVFTVTKRFSIPGDEGGFYYGAPADEDSGYYGEAYYGIQGLDELWRQEWSAAGQSSQLQIEIETETTVDASIAEVGVRFTS